MCINGVIYNANNQTNFGSYVLMCARSVCWVSLPTRASERANIYFIYIQNIKHMVWISFCNEKSLNTIARSNT